MSDHDVADIYLVIPTFREVRSIKRLLDSLVEQIVDRKIKILLCNSNPGDETTLLISAYSSVLDIEEIPGCPTEFWSAAVNNGLKKTLCLSSDDRNIIIILNADVELDHDALENLAEFMARSRYLHLVGGLGRSGDVFVPSGFSVVNRWFGINHHFFSGMSTQEFDFTSEVAVDFVVGRFMAFSTASLKKVGLIPNSYFPHYNADLVYSYLFKRNGVRAFILPKAGYISDRDNTGLSVYSNKHNTLGSRLKDLFSLRNPSNPKYRLKYITYVFPVYLWPTLMFSYALKTSLEVIIGGARIRRVFGSKNRGYSEL